jgi:hypothetical protein
VRVRAWAVSVACGASCAPCGTQIKTWSMGIKGKPDGSLRAVESREQLELVHS